MRDARLLVCVIAGAVALAGCGGLAFRVTRHERPSIALRETPRALWLAVDRTDSLSSRLGERLAVSLGDLAPTRVVQVGAPPEAGVVVIALAVRRSISHRSALVHQPVWTCDPTGLCYSRPLARIVDLPVVRVLVRLSVHDAGGGSLAAPRILDATETGEDELSAELRLLSQLSAEIDAAFRPSVEELTLGVEEVEGATGTAIRAATMDPVTSACEEVARRATQEPSRGRRGRALFAAGQCMRAVAARGSRDGGDAERAGLRRAEALLVAAMRAETREPYARALHETRALLRVIARREERETEEPPPRIPEPPPSYR